ncbi:MAG: hypothetical protein LBK50_00270 [Candidatus Nomurabacteria bacterium]|jgi:hypothetical protein|nr:hypothetical protein [Candidatus Nomurabacteria bacterium]
MITEPTPKIVNADGALKAVMVVSDMFGVYEEEQREFFETDTKEFIDDKVCAFGEQEPYSPDEDAREIAANMIVTLLKNFYGISSVSGADAIIIEVVRQRVIWHIVSTICLYFFQKLVLLPRKL